VTGVSGALSLEKSATTAMIRIDSPDAASINQMIGGAAGVGLGMAIAQSQGKMELSNSTKKVGGADVGEMTIKFKGMQPKEQEAVAAVAGGDSVVIQHGVVGQAVGITVSGRPDAFSALQAGGSLGAGDQLKGAVAMLPQNAAFALLVDPINALQLAKRVTRATGKESPLATANIPENGGFPLGVALSVEPDGMIFHIVVPSASIKGVAPILKTLD